MLLLFPSIARAENTIASLCFMWSCDCILCSSLGRGACCMREREENPQTKRLMILRWALPVATSPWDPHLKTPNWVSTLNCRGGVLALPARWQPCPPQEVNSVSDVLIIDIWHFTLAGKVLTRCCGKCMGGNHLHSYNNYYFTNYHLHLNVMTCSWWRAEHN